MSHIVTIKTEVRDVAAIQAACQRLTLPPPVNGTFELFSSTARGYAVKLPNWQYPVVCDVATGQVAYDNYSGQWGDQQELHKFLQAYAVENSKRSQCTSINGRI